MSFTLSTSTAARLQRAWTSAYTISRVRFRRGQTAGRAVQGLDLRHEEVGLCFCHDFVMDTHSAVGSGLEWLVGRFDASTGTLRWPGKEERVGGHYPQCSP
eukprot:1190949-Pyramimonas_sp.AAC.3